MEYKAMPYLLNFELEIKNPLNTFQFSETTDINIDICIEQYIKIFSLIIYAGIIKKKAAFFNGKLSFNTTLMERGVV